MPDGTDLSVIEWFLILLAAASGSFIVLGTVIRRHREAFGAIDRYGCLLPSVGLGVVGLGMLTLLVMGLDGEMDAAEALAATVPAYGLGLGIGYGFNKSEWAETLGELGSYGAGLGALLLSGGLWIGLGGQPAGDPTGQPPPPAAETPVVQAEPPGITPSPAAPVTPQQPVLTPATPAVTPASTPTATPAAVGEQSAFLGVLDPLGLLTPAWRSGYVGAYRSDPPSDHSHATGEMPGYTPPFVDIAGQAGFVWDLDAAGAELLEEAFPCAYVNTSVVDCFGEGHIGAGEWVFVHVVTGGPWPDELPPQGMVIFGVVFDEDGDPETGFQPDPMFPGDSYQGSDVWYEALYVPDGRRLTAATDATMLGADGFPVRGQMPSAARVVSWLGGPEHGPAQAEFLLIVPRSEVGRHYRAVVIGTQDRSTLAASRTSHDYTEDGEPFRPHQLVLLMPIEEQ